VTERPPLVRVRAGDYLLLADETTLYRVYSYQEDGSPLVGTFWAGAKYDRPFRDADDVSLEWDRWTTVAGPFATRRDVLDCLLRVPETN
jgi:hypothetical protein